MYSNKENIQQLLGAMLGQGIRHVVLSPGSRNAPLIHSITQHPGFTCYTIVDERSASYFALGLILRLQQPVAVCCTSGTALLNYSSATAEAYYQKLPLLVISADRPRHWIGQADGQTINQQNVLENYVRRSINLPEVHGDEDKWLCNRLANEALLALSSGDAGPVHINIPLSEPLYEFTEEHIPPVRLIRRIEGKAVIPNSYISDWEAGRKKLLVVGQLLPCYKIRAAVEQLAKRHDAVVVAEHTANLPNSVSVDFLEQILTSLSLDEEPLFAPELLITVGGHIVSKKLKQFLRRNKPAKHWHVGSEVVDTFQSLTDLLDVAPDALVEAVAGSEKGDSAYYDCWMKRSAEVGALSEAYLATVPYTDLSVFASIFRSMPGGISLHLGNSTPVRYAQQFKRPDNVQVFCNRGTSGIDGVVSTFAGYSVNASELSLLVVGELSFLYDSNGLWNRYLSPKCRIIVVNNSGGGIFRLIDGPSRSHALEQHIEYSHTQSVKSIALAFGVEYCSASTQQELDAQLTHIFDTSIERPLLLEVFTPSKVNAAVYKDYFEHLKTI